MTGGGVPGSGRGAGVREPAPWITRVWGRLACLVVLTSAWACGPPEVARGADEGARAGWIRPPEGDGRPVLTDGIFSAGEWDDALRIPIDEAATLHLKQLRDHVFMGVSITGLEVPVVDLFLQAGEGPIIQFHASAQLGERRLSPAGEADPEFVWGRTTDWYANEVRYDPALRDSLEAAGDGDRAAIQGSLYPYDGFEMQFRRAKLSGSLWRMRIEVAGGPDYRNPHVFPGGTERKDMSTWAVLSLAEHPDA